ncbi:hypothetical protein C7W93_17945 [Glaciimonas sp. PCH181]|nr:hypothetical protein C7W93_17945 [Glaciimonas sp. PCH181]
MASLNGFTISLRDVGRRLKWMLQGVMVNVRNKLKRRDQHQSDYWLSGFKVSLGDMKKTYGLREAFLKRERLVR